MSPRPPLPQRHENPHLGSLGTGALPPVKYQVLDRDGHEVLVGRMKIPTPSGHAFILRRFDTGAISLTTMFRAAYPTASELDEKKETNWVKETYNLAGNNGSAKEPAIVRLAGTWVSPDVALHADIAGVYKLDTVLPEVANAVPDPSGIYRKSTKASPVKGGAAASPLPTPAPSLTLPTPKRRRESSPTPGGGGFSSPAVATELQGGGGLPPPPRRSARTKSPAPVPLPMPVRSPTKGAAALVTPSKPAKTTTVRSSVRRSEVFASTPGGSDETVVEEEEEQTETVEMARPSMAEDVSEQRALIERLKAERGRGAEAEAGEDADTTMMKRAREEEELEGDEGGELRFNFKEPETEERQIATNRRVGRFSLEPQQKSFAWGVAAFAIGMGAMSYLPNFL
ncbi:hypothetical protein CONPUDRAFT_150933 [Coniophora puteana RWD-64-598 SS2]|uniref:HTH APSES-type domain-containing protein n=1 Tax=Coniophora puteana (strain RWD-64-598) TaxID=741705 RepID=A0A5M3MYM1_CONPW|nr:uncharacterized protein CONPUDRAFT_150933 [Coniophora puteana RWD-64-598 SS2]EIW83884.1 hypothetical protein CONPUDRAFT_150933 [Coniophora puteana RWD-64-598 SS2]